MFKIYKFGKNLNLKVQKKFMIKKFFNYMIIIDMLLLQYILNMFTLFL